MPATRLFARSRASFSTSAFRYFFVVLFLLAGVGLAPLAVAGSSNPVPYVDLVSPVSIHPGTTNVTMTISGTGFVPTSVVNWNGTALATTYVSNKKLTAAVPDSFVAAVGLGSVTVFNPKPNGGTSNVVYVPVAALEVSTNFPSTANSTVNTGTTPQGIVTADFNGDGKLDLAVANNGSSNVSILLGNGDGTFTTASTPAAGSGANWLAVGDFNEDGKLDLAVANLGSSGLAGVTILLNNGNGNFTAGATPPTGNGPFAIVAADFNQDGHLDLAVTNSVDGTVTLLLGAGDGTFSLGSTSTVGAHPQLLVPGDFNEDGILDLAVSNETDNTVSILIGKGDGTFQTQTTVAVGGSGAPIGLIAADFTGQGHVDLAAVNASDVAILLGNGTGAFALNGNPTTGSGNLIAGVAGDYNGDGFVDLVVADATSGQAFLLPGNGNGTFGSVLTFTTASGSFDVATADFNGDGALDLAITNGGANNVSIFLQQLPVSLVPTSLSFGYQLINTTSTAQSVVLTNNTGGALNFTSIGFTGMEAGDFAETDNCGASIANMATCTINVTFTPLASGPLGATLQIVDNASNSPQTLAVSGIGATPPAITSANNTIFVLGTPESFMVTTTGIPTASITEGGSLPSGVTFVDNGDGTATLAGTPAAGTAGSYSLTITAHNGFGSNATQVFTLDVVAPQIISKAFGATAIPLNATTSLSFTITNPAANPLSLAGIAFVDSFPAGIVVSTPNGLSGTCGGGTITATAASGSVSLAGATLAAGASCTFSVSVTGSTAGVKNNSVSSTSTTAGTGNTANASLTVVSPAVIGKAFGVPSIPLNGSTSLTFTVQNNNTTTTLHGIAFNDTFPAGLVISTPNGLSGSCGGGTITATQGTSVVSVSAASLAQTSSCTFSVNVTGTAAGTLNNTTGSVMSTEGGTGGTASASLMVVAPPAIAKVFNPTEIAVNTTSSLTFTITNPAANTVALTGVAFSDSIPLGLTLTSASSAACGGTVTTTAPRTISLAGAGIAIGGSCMFSVTITGAAQGQYTNTTGAVTSTNGGTGNTASANLTVVGPPTIAKAFGASTIPLNGTTSLTFTVTNSNATATLTGLAFTDSFPAGLVVAATNGLTNNCGGTATAAAGAASISLTGGTRMAGLACTVTVNVTGTTAGVKNNSVQATSNEGGTGTTANASITVVGPPGIAKAFGASSIPLNGSTSLSFTIQNNNTTTTLDGIAFSDTLPSGLVISTPNGLSGTCGGGSITATQATNVVSLTGASLAQSASCTFAVNVTGTVAGAQNNTTGNVTSTEGGTGATASASLTVVAPPVIAKAFNPAGIPLAGTTALGFTLTNPTVNTAPLTGVAFTDTLPTGLTVVNGTSAACGGTVTTTAPAGISLAGATIAAGGTCVFNVTVTGATAGQYTNVTGSVSSANGGMGNTASANLSVAAPPAITKSFGAATAPLNSSTMLSFTINNPNAAIPLSGIAFTDSLPAGLVVSTPNGVTGTCGSGTITATAGSGSISLASATLAASASCTFSVNVTGITAGPQANTTSPISSTQSGAGATSNTATLTVLAAPLISKAFGAGSVMLGSSTSLTFTVSNPNATVALAGVAFTDNLPAGLVVSTPNGMSGTCGAGTITAGAGTGSINLTGGTIAANGSCTFAVNVTAMAGGAQVNTTGAVSSTNAGTGTSATASVTVLVPDLTIVKSHSGNFTQSQTGATYSITVSNNGAAPTLGIVSVVDTLPTGLTATAMAGSGWTCVLSSLTCTRSDSLAINASYPTITLSVKVAFNAAPSIVNAATVSGGGETNTANDTAMDTTTVIQVIDLGMAKSHTASFYQGQVGATYSLTVSNVAGTASNGIVTVVDSLPASLTATAISGNGWSCTLATVTCTRSDSLAVGASYPVIALTVSVAANAPASVTNTATLSGGGDSNNANNTASDPTVITPPPDFSITASPSTDTVVAGHTGSFTLVLTPINQPFANAITFSATGMPVKSAFTVNPMSVTPGASPGMAEAVVYTASGNPFTGKNLMPGRAPLAAVLPAVWLLLGLGFRKRWAKQGFRARVLLVFLALACSLVAYGCAGSRSNFPLLGTTPGTYTITVTATSGAIQHSTNVTLTVTP